MTVDQPIGTAVLHVSSNVAPEVHAAFSQWCDRVHHFDTMRIEGFLSLRRFELVEGIADDGGPEFRVLTLYQVAKSGDAAFDTPSYARHTATYAPPPPGVVDHIEFDRAVYERTESTLGATQPVGEACITLVGQDGPWLQDAVEIALATPGVLGAYRVVGETGGVTLVDAVDVPAGRATFAALREVGHGGGRRSLQLFRQVFPERGVLVRDREVRGLSGLGPFASGEARSGRLPARATP